MNNKCNIKNLTDNGMGTVHQKNMTNEKLILDAKRTSQIFKEQRQKNKAA